VRIPHEMRYQTLERRRMEADARRSLKSPAQARGSKREGRRCRMRDPFVAIELFGKACAIWDM